MDTTVPKFSRLNIEELRFHHSKIQRGWVRLVHDLQAIMTKDQFQEVLLKARLKRGIANSPGSQGHRTTHVLPLQTDGDTTLKKVKSRQKSTRRAA